MIPPRNALFTVETDSPVAAANALASKTSSSILSRILSVFTFIWVFTSFQLDRLLQKVNAANFYVTQLVGQTHW